MKSTFMFFEHKNTILKKLAVHHHHHHHFIFYDFYVLKKKEYIKLYMRNIDTILKVFYFFVLWFSYFEYS
jgi:hypothetical protein